MLKIFGNYNIEFKPNVLNGEEKLSFWKIRLRCNGDSVDVTRSSGSDNLCGSDFVNSDNLKFVNLRIENKSEENQQINVKFRAFDKNGLWIASEDVNVTVPVK